MNWLVRRKFLVLLSAIAVLMVFYPILHANYSERILWDFVVTGMFLATLMVIFTEKHMKAPALLLGIPTIAGVWVDYTLPGLPRLPLVISFHLVAGLFFFFTVAGILGHIYRDVEITPDSIFGAFCGYILVGLAFGHLYGVIESAAPGSFQVNGEQGPLNPLEDRSYFLLSYFSLITLTTVGYGDITPLNHGARGLALVEAIIGQFYIAVLIGELIGKRVASALSDKKSDFR